MGCLLSRSFEEIPRMGLREAGDAALPQKQKAGENKNKWLGTQPVPLKGLSVVFGQPMDIHLGYPFSFILFHPTTPLFTYPSHPLHSPYPEISTENISGR